MSTAIVALTIALTSNAFRQKDGHDCRFPYGDLAERSGLCDHIGQRITVYIFRFVGVHGLVRAVDSQIWRALSSSGLMFGAASYFRPIGLLLPIVLWLSDIFRWRKLRKGCRVMLAFIDRCRNNYCAVDDTECSGLRALCADVDIRRGQSMDGKQSGFDGSYLPLPVWVQGLSEYDQNKILSEDALLYISEHPIEFISRTLKKVALLHMTETIAITWNTEGIKQRFGESALFPLKLVTQGYWTGVLLLAFGGIVVLFGVVDFCGADKSGAVDLDLFHGRLFNFRGGGPVSLSIPPVYFHVCRPPDLSLRNGTNWIAERNAPALTKANAINHLSMDGGLRRLKGTC